jgi:hypothetical protein
VRPPLIEQRVRASLQDHLPQHNCPEPGDTANGARRCDRTDDAGLAIDRMEGDARARLQATHGQRCKGLWRDALRENFSTRLVTALSHITERPGARREEDFARAGRPSRT